MIKYTPTSCLVTRLATKNQTSPLLWTGTCTRHGVVDRDHTPCLSNLLHRPWSIKSWRLKSSIDMECVHVYMNLLHDWRLIKSKITHHFQRCQNHQQVAYQRVSLQWWTISGERFYFSTCLCMRIYCSRNAKYIYRVIQKKRSEL
jgi:hypothetical protein